MIQHIWSNQRDEKQCWIIGASEYTYGTLIQEQALSPSLRNSVTLFIYHDDQINAQSWTRILHEYRTSMTIPDLSGSNQLREFFQRFNSPGSLAKVWLEVELSIPGSGQPAMTSFERDDFAGQERCQELRRREGEVAGADYLACDSELLSITPLHEHFESVTASYHLVSLPKRCSLQDWPSSLSISGFAKVGYPTQTTLNFEGDGGSRNKTCQLK